MRLVNSALYSSSYPPTKLARSLDGGKTWEALANDDGWHYKAYSYGTLAGGAPPKAPTAAKPSPKRVARLEQRSFKTHLGALHVGESVMRPDQELIAGGIGPGHTFSQLYAAAGYVVFYANPRGSTSYGEEFGNLIHHAYPGNDYDDLMSGIDAVQKLGYVDEKNLFVTGGSGGGERLCVAARRALPAAAAECRAREHDDDVPTKDGSGTPTT